MLIHPLANSVADRALFFAQQPIDVIKIHSLKLRSHQSQAPRKVAQTASYKWSQVPVKAASSATSSQLEATLQLGVLASWRLTSRLVALAVGLSGQTPPYPMAGTGVDSNPTGRTS